MLKQCTNENHLQNAKEVVEMLRSGGKFEYFLQADNVQSKVISAITKMRDGLNNQTS